MVEIILGIPFVIIIIKKRKRERDRETEREREEGMLCSKRGANYCSTSLGWHWADHWC